MKLELFILSTCPYCKRVLTEMEKESRQDIDIYDISKDKEAGNRLMEIGGKSQVPCLFIDGKPMYESMDIISWLKENR